MSDRLRDRARGRWADILGGLGFGGDLLTGKHSSCPMCGGKDRFRFDDKKGGGTWICSQCGAGDGVQLVMKHFDWDFATAATEVEKMLGDARQHSAVVRPVKSIPDTDLQSTWRNCKMVWHDAFPLREGDPAWLYLKNRGVPFRDEYRNHLRFHPRLNYVEDGKAIQLPALLAAVCDVTGEGLNILRTYITSDGQKADVSSPRKLMSGSVPKGAAIRLGKAAPIMGIAEGIETAMAAAQLHDVPVWAAVHSAGLKAWQPPATVKRVIIFGDNDTNFAGQDAANSLAVRLSDDGFYVDIRIPSRAGADWNDVLRGAA